MWRVVGRRVAQRALPVLARGHGTSSRAKELREAPSLKEFMAKQAPSTPMDQVAGTPVPYLDATLWDSRQRKVFFEVYGCQMNVNDSEIVWSIMQEAGCVRTDSPETADVVFLMTCAIRENAEHKIWHRLEYLSSLRRKNPSMRVALLGCMAERLKAKLLERDKLVDVVCGPDAYRDLPRLLHVVEETGQASMNVMLSLEETYADITPVRLNPDTISAFVSIMRGCDNMCSYCIVPFTRGRERSRPGASILDEVRQLTGQGIREITLLGQNVNSYRDMTATPILTREPRLSDGFRTIYKTKEGGARFADLIDQVAAVNGEVRIRFTSPHPKDFPDELLQVIASRPNVCKSIHLPAQSGSSSVLDRMRRGYTREAYLELVDRMRAAIPGVALSSDFIVGFCGETEEEHLDTLSLLEAVRYDHAYLFAYSLREKTHAHRNYTDDVPHDVKQRRLREVIDVFQRHARAKAAAQVGTYAVVLVDGASKRSPEDLCGRADNNKMVFFPNAEMIDVRAPPTADAHRQGIPQKGDYVIVRITHATSQTFRGVPVMRTTLADAAALGLIGSGDVPPSTKQMLELCEREAVTLFGRRDGGSGARAEMEEGM